MHPVWRTGGKEGDSMTAIDPAALELPRTEPVDMTILIQQALDRGR
jgi:hypothetical protein